MVRIHSFISKIGLFLAFSFVSNGSFSQEIAFSLINSSMDWDKVQKAAEVSGKKIFLDLYATWCGPCKMMDAKVYNDSGVAHYFNETFINAKADGESEFGKVLARQFNLTAYPSMYFVGASNGFIFTVVGFRDAQSLLGIGKTVDTNSERYQTLSEKSAAGQITSEEKSEYLNLLLSFGQKDLYQKEASLMLNNFSKEDVLNPANKDLILNGSGTLGNKTVNAVIENKDHFRNVWGNEKFTGYMAGIFNNSIRAAISERDETKMKEVEEVVIPVYLNDNPSGVIQAKFNTRKIFYSETGQWDKYISTVEDHYKNYFSGDTKFFYNEAFYIVEHQIFNSVLLEQGLEWIKRGNTEDFNSCFLSAIMNTYRKDYAMADIWFEKAKPLAIKAEEKTSLNELRGYINKLKNGP